MDQPLGFDKPATSEWSTSRSQAGPLQYKVAALPLCTVDCILKISTVGSELSCWLMLEASTIKLYKSGVPSKGQSQNLDLQLPAVQVGQPNSMLERID